MGSQRTTGSVIAAHMPRAPPMRRTMFSAVSSLMRLPHVLAQVLTSLVTRPMGAMTAEAVAQQGPTVSAFGSARSSWPTALDVIVCAARAVLVHATPGPHAIGQVLQLMLASCHHKAVPSVARGGGSDDDTSPAASVRQAAEVRRMDAGTGVASEGKRREAHRAGDVPAVDPQPTSDPGDVHVQAPVATAMVLQVFGLGRTRVFDLHWPSFWPGLGSRKVSGGAESVVTRPGFVDAFIESGGVQTVATLLSTAPRTPQAAIEVVAPVLRWLDDWTRSQGWTDAEADAGHANLWLCGHATVTRSTLQTNSPGTASPPSNASGARDRTRLSAPRPGSSANLLGSMLGGLLGDENESQTEKVSFVQVRSSMGVIQGLFLVTDSICVVWAGGYGV